MSRPINFSFEEARTLLRKWLGEDGANWGDVEQAISVVLTELEAPCADAADIPDATLPDAEAADESFQLFAEVTKAIKHTYIGVSSSELKAQRAAQKVLQIVMEHYTKAAQGPANIPDA